MIIIIKIAFFIIHSINFIETKYMLINSECELSVLLLIKTIESKTTENIFIKLKQPYLESYSTRI
ncbi:MAG: hypothetical protein CVV23_14540 [Ignavibacteriae bacterium HGW-Ignavibacteriae-2]|nr:MAG: hypothetical protein CVV23_14540 [Ignavibacteriae bacterium HGW-Ignavibacteriae-2]